MIKQLDCEKQIARKLKEIIDIAKKYDPEMRTIYMEVDVKTESLSAYSDFESKNINFNGFGREISFSGSNKKSLF